MLTIKENLRETLKKDGKPDRFVNQYEFMHLVYCPHSMISKRPQYGEENVQNAWGVYFSYPEGTPGAFPVHTPEKILIKDIEHWQDYLKAPKASRFPDEMWEVTQNMAKAADPKNQFICPMIAPGIFENCHHFLSITEALMAFYDYPDEMHDIIKVLTDYELEIAEDICSHLHPDGLFHHDDWGSQQSTFMSVPMFEDFFLDAYKQIYGYYHDHGVEVIVHHCDSYSATLVPDMIEMGMDIWQGAMSTNNVPELVKKYKGQIGIMAGIDSAWVDNPEWNIDTIRHYVKKVCDEYDEPNGFIPCITQGGPMSTYPDVYNLTSHEIKDYNIARFGVGTAIESGFALGKTK